MGFEGAQKGPPTRVLGIGGLGFRLRNPEGPPKRVLGLVGLGFRVGVNEPRRKQRGFGTCGSDLVSMSLPRRGG